MSFRVQDLVIHVKKVEALCRPTCATTQDLVAAIEATVGEGNQHLVKPLCDKINAQIKDPTQEELIMLEADLQAALVAVQTLKATQSKTV
jgi:hypothetical protein